VKSKHLITKTTFTGLPGDASELVVEVGSEKLLDKLPHIVRLCVHAQALHLRHVLEEHVGGNLVAGVGPEAVLEVVEVEAEADEPADGLARHAGAGLTRLELPAGREHTLQHVKG